ncbi:MAG TPA: peptide MFS transporter [Ignavibacteria bacterium]
MESTVKLKHPKGLALLFVTEMWERFSFYGMQAIFYLYMINALVFDKIDADMIYGNYIGMVYITAILGGYMADRYLGNRKAIVTGGVLMAIGQFLLFTSGIFYINKPVSVVFLILGLIFLCLGNGFFKPNISTMVGKLYPENDKRIDAAFTIFYMGINLGGLLAPIICGFVGNTGNLADFKWGYFAAGTGMVLSLIIFSIYKAKYLTTPEGEPIGVIPAGAVKKDEKGKKKINIKDIFMNLGVFIIVLVIFKYLLNADTFGSFIYAIFFTAPLSIITDKTLTKIEKQKIVALFILILFTMVFWAAFGQLGSSITFFADKQMDRSIFGFNIPPSVFQSFGPLFIVTFAPVMAIVWTFLAKRSKEPSIPVKLGFGLLFMALAWVILIIGIKLITPGVKVGMVWLILMYFTLTIGELCLSPIGLSMVFKLAPVKFAAILMAIWFLSLGTSFKLSGVMSALYPQEAVRTEIILPDKKIVIKSYDSLYEIKPDSAYLSKLQPNQSLDERKVWEANIDNGKLLTMDEQNAPADFKIDSAKIAKLDFALSSDDAYIKGKTKFLYRFTPDGQNVFIIKNNNVIEKWNINPVKPKLLGFEIKTLIDFFLIFVIFAGVSSIILFALVKPILKMMHGVR